MTLARYFWRIAAIVMILLACLAIALEVQLNMTATGRAYLGWPGWLLIALSLWLGIDRLRTK